MPKVRQAKPPAGAGKLPDIELFPDVSIGDAPVITKKGPA
jgi:hypothetical protein